jgi:hypothetical protein
MWTLINGTSGFASRYSPNAAGARRPFVVTAGAGDAAGSSESEHPIEIRPTTPTAANNARRRRPRSAKYDIPS